MNQDIKDKWVAALRSGEYKQGKRKLRNKDKFCCLGVLCDVYSKEKGVEWSKENTYFGFSEILPKIVADWSGLQDSDPKLSDKSVYPYSKVELSYLNDSYNFNFFEIANLIEAQL
jgi:hypothetical protein